VSRKESMRTILWIQRFVESASPEGVELNRLLAIVRLKHGFAPVTVRAWLEDLVTLGKITIERLPGMPELVRSGELSSTLPLPKS